MADTQDDVMKQASTIQFPRDVEFMDDLQLFVYRPRGVLNEGAVNRVIRALGELEFSKAHPFHRFCDTSKADTVDLNFRYVLHISLYRRLSYSGRPPIKSAILATDTTAIHYARLHAMLTQGSPIKVRIFQEYKEAAKWLKVPVDRLTAQTVRNQASRRTAASRQGLGSLDKARSTRLSRPARHSRFLDDMP